MITVGVAGLILSFMFYQTQLVPRFLAIWGLIGYAILLLGSVLQVLGLNLNSIHAIPGGLWELFIGVWLIAKGFSTSSQLPSEPAISAKTPVVTPPLVGSATP
jgi:hypothetical protein